MVEGVSQEGNRERERERERERARASERGARGVESKFLNTATPSFHHRVRPMLGRISAEEVAKEIIREDLAKEAEAAQKKGKGEGEAKEVAEEETPKNNGGGKPKKSARFSDEPVAPKKSARFAGEEEDEGNVRVEYAPTPVIQTPVKAPKVSILGTL